MDVQEVIEELYSYASKPHAFNIEELLAFLEVEVEPEVLRRNLDDSKFILIRSEHPDTDRYILDSELFKWFSRLNMRLAINRQFRLTEHQVASQLSNLRNEGRWNHVPNEIINWGAALGLISSCFMESQYAFPLARILYLKNKKLCNSFFQNIPLYCETEVWKNPTTELIEKHIDRGFACYDKKISLIVQCRENLLDGRKHTLQELGSIYKLTRERIRQLETTFWNSLYLYNRRLPFLSAFYYDYFRESGSLLLENNTPKAVFRNFLAKCVGIPRLELPRLNITVIGLLAKEAKLLESERWDLPWINLSEISNYLESKFQLPLSIIDIQTLADKVEQFREKYLSRSKKLYIALHSIGRPAHYSEITKIYNSIWPNIQLSEKSVHTCLGKTKKNIVWIGIKGTFALREWGFERPSNTLFKTIEDIMQKRFKETKQPVPLSVIIAELGKYRKVVNPRSLIIATRSNPRIKMVLKDLFVPREPNPQPQEVIPAKELDEIFKDFRKTL